MSLPYESIPARALDASGAALLAHLVDAAGFRFRRAVGGLNSHIAAFQPAGGGMGILALLQHMRVLAANVRGATTGQKPDADEASLVEVVRGTLDDLKAASAALADADEAALLAVEVRSSRGANGDLFTLVHGPLADFLTHVGQVNTLRRIAGSPAPPTDHFAGRALEGPAGPAPKLVIDDADLAEATFRNVALTGARFDDVSLAGAKFTNATFAGATLHDVDLSNVRITNANTDGLLIDGEPWNTRSDRT